MTTTHIPFEEIRFFSSFISDYILEKKTLRNLYHRFPTLDNFKSQIKEKHENYSNEHRKVLVSALEKQYQGIPTSNEVLENINLLAKSNTFTVTTGHQLSLFTGPLYFIYKIISTINTAKLLSQTYPDYHFVPVYWEATEDHDFEEINHFHLENKKIVWNSKQTGMTGNFNTQSLEKVYSVLKQEFGLGKYAEELNSLFKKSYLEHSSLALATRFLVNSLFKTYGLVVVDGNCSELKNLFAPYMERELFEKTAQKNVSQSVQEIQNINPSYPIQVNPREINLFYLTPNGRNRIVNNEKHFEVLNTNLQFTELEIRKELQEFPERFSPNVIMRPLYQEVILPNLCYIGGGGEIAYWLQLKRFFEAEKISFPMLMLRNSVLITTQKQTKKINKLGIPIKDFFLKRNDLQNKITKKWSEFPIDFTKQKTQLQKQFVYLYELAEKTDTTFLNAVKAQEIKQLKGLNQLEKRLLKAQKRKFEDEIRRVIQLQEELFPNGSLQERFNNFSLFYQEEGYDFIETLIKELNPFDFRFLVINQ
ncbi:bacillithiol biosynthesis cysteine-adding enzyme BshC [Capnocytophaga canimorsus]|uniref:bacillithiol biosynthesis cysteine-adding enzyme BshC n=1 Tax=Capnocytophaga canimorsus TaxID=28188 RepID=UPI0037D73C42